MRRALFIAAALTLATAPMALAQDRDHGGGRPSGESHPNGHAGPPAGAPPSAAPANSAPQGGYRGPPLGANDARGQPRTQFRGDGDNFRGQPRAAFLGGQYPARPPGGVGGYPQTRDGRDGYDDHRAGYGFQGGDRGFRGDYTDQDRGDHGYRGGGGFHGPRHFDYRGRSYASFRAAPFRYPQGWGYRRWGVGAFLPGLFLGEAYFIGDWGAYDLGPPPPGEHWVRYGPDALLVNNYTGQVDDVAYGVFYW